MKLLRIAAIVVVVLAAIVVVAAPIGPLPGFFIGGEATSAPTPWPDTSEVDEIRLKVPGTLPRVVIIWVIDHEGELYVLGSSDSGWVRGIGAGGPVEMRLGDQTFALTATPVREGMREIFEAYVAKYEADYPDIIAGMPSIEEAESFASIFRLDRP